MMAGLPWKQRMTAKVFISYRREDSAGHAGRVHDRLQRDLGRDLLFMDVDAIPLGENFVKVIRDQVARCDVLLALIGPNWLDVTDERGGRRLDNPTDPVRIEISSALERDIPVIPILLNGAEIPGASQLPADLQELSLRNGLEIRHASFHGDMDKLIGGLTRRRPFKPPRGIYFDTTSRSTFDSFTAAAINPQSLRLELLSVVGGVLLGVLVPAGLISGGLFTFSLVTRVPLTDNIAAGLSFGLGLTILLLFAVYLKRWSSMMSYVLPMSSINLFGFGVAALYGMPISTIIFPLDLIVIIGLFIYRRRQPYSP
jgi:hypothetical protein